MASTNIDTYEDLATGSTDISFDTYSPTASDATAALKKSALAMTMAEIPQEVQDRIAQMSAERGIAAGRGTSSLQSQRLTLRDLGVNALQYMSAGQEALAQAAQLENTFELGKAELAQQKAIAAAELSQKQQAQNLAYISALSEEEQGGAKLALAAAELQSTNRARRLEAENQLILANAEIGVPDIQQLLADIGGYDTEGGRVLGYFEQPNISAQTVIERYGLGV